MTKDNALLPPTIHLGYLTDEMVISHVRRAKETIRFVGPGLSLEVATQLRQRWLELGTTAVEIVIDADADLCRLGYPALEIDCAVEYRGCHRQQGADHEQMPSPRKDWCSVDCVRWADDFLHWAGQAT